MDLTDRFASGSRARLGGGDSQAESDYQRRIFYDPSASFPGSELVNPNEVFSDPGYRYPAPFRNSSAQVGLWMTPVAIIIFPLLIVTMILGIIGYVRAHKPTVPGRHSALATMVVSGVGILAWAVACLLIWFS